MDPQTLAGRRGGSPSSDRALPAVRSVEEAPATGMDLPASPLLPTLPAARDVLAHEVPD